MTIVCESEDLNDYLIATAEVDYNEQSIADLTATLREEAVDKVDFIQKAFEYVRDEIHHSWDLQSNRVTCNASEVLQYKEGICYAKSNLLCAILRRAGVPAGYCYQRLTLGDTPDTGYCIHALNAAYISELDRWLRFDARGNKQGIQAEFSLQEEKLAFPIRQEYGEIDYPTIYAAPHPVTIETLRRNTDCLVMYQHGLPQVL
ncbi:transglutaminase superfamily protein [Paenibacillus cellulosilyticus]|uniref:Transglutaminase superfamily protein n=1 Tax=Paenibacillus cellulosilyticus TaxID=375489 RepID=A0A2V2YLU2_9BACL|nr:transglutaminase family protein [Paenibacillus cellulosilyticus]PWV95224.1 transglutaminase superfamily protein [Paenibacillus cellulosilyticus]QKS46028.1 transglutaminase family protein [Paenibacillus cellulosilyticus]